MSSNHDLFCRETESQIYEIQTQRDEYGFRIGITASCFDLLHPGHVTMLMDARAQCDLLVVALQTDPTIDRPDTKNKPVQTYEERELMVRSNRYVDRIIKYATEADFYRILVALKPDIRILGSDYVNKSFTGDDLPIPIHFHQRNHSWSTTDFRRRVYEAESNKKRVS